MTTLFRWRSALAVAMLLAAGSQAFAQAPSKAAHIGYVYPGGGCRGTTFDVVVGGENMGPPDARRGLDYEVVIKGKRIKDIADVFISGGGIKAEVVSWYRPMTQGEAVRIGIQTMAKIEDVEKQEGRKITVEEAHKLLGITEEHLEEQKKYRKREADHKRQPNPQIAEELTIRVQISPDAAVGERELRFLTEAGMSNPLYFYVGQYPETSEREPNDVVPEPTVQIKLPMVVNGQVFPGDVDRFEFEAKKGTKLVARCDARGLIPYLADGVPGWFQAILHLYDDKGKEVAFADSLGFLHDPCLYYEVPKDGKYVIEVHDSIFRGREDFTYRITLGEIPFVTGLFPLGGRAGEPCDVQVKGWNLPVQSIRLNPEFARGRSLLPVVIEKNNISSNRVGFLVDSLREIDEKEPNNTPDAAQEITVPIVINGRIDRVGDVDFFKFTGLGTVVAEVYARRLYSPLDSVVRLTDSEGKVLAYNDDYEDRAWPLITHHADSRLLTTTKGAHFISIGDAQGRGGPDYAYRLYVRPPRPDFDLRVTPSSVTARPGSSVPITVYALRRDGFNDDIALELENAPKGFVLSGAWVPGGQDQVRLTLTVPPEPSKEPFLLQLYGQALVQGRRILRPAFPSDEMIQAFILQHIVPTKDWAVFVTGGAAGKLPCTSVDKGIRIPINGTGQARFLVDQGTDARNLRFELSEPPKGISIQEPVAVERGVIVPIKCEPDKLKAGQKGNLLFVLSQERSFLSKTDKKLVTSKWVMGMLPAIPFEIASGKR